MTEYRKRPRDPAQLAKFIVDVATGEIEEKKPPQKTEEPQPSANSSKRVKTAK